MSGVVTDVRGHARYGSVDGSDLADTEMSSSVVDRYSEEIICRACRDVFFDSVIHDCEDVCDLL